MDHYGAPDAALELGENGHANGGNRGRPATDFMTATSNDGSTHDHSIPSSSKSSYDVPASNMARMLVDFCGARVAAWLSTLLNGASSWEARHKRWSLWYSVNAFATAAAAALVLFFTLQGLVSLFSRTLAWSHFLCTSIVRTTNAFAAFLLQW